MIVLAVTCWFFSSEISCCLSRGTWNSLGQSLLDWDGLYVCVVCRLEVYFAMYTALSQWNWCSWHVTGSRSRHRQWSYLTDSNGHLARWMTQTFAVKNLAIWLSLSASWLHCQRLDQSATWRVSELAFCDDVVRFFLQSASEMTYNVSGGALNSTQTKSFSALMLLVGRQEGHLACKKTEWWGAGMVICLEQGADLHTAQLMPLLLTVSC